MSMTNICNLEYDEIVENLFKQFNYIFTRSMTHCKENGGLERVCTTAHIQSFFSMMKKIIEENFTIEEQKNIYLCILKEIIDKLHSFD